MKTDTTQSPTELAAVPCSALVAALDDGQEVKIFKLMGAGAGYCVTIHGDCCCESRSKPTLEEAVTAAAKKYEEWVETSDSDDDDDDDDYSPNEPGHDDDGCPTT